MNILISWLTLSVAVWVAAWLVPGFKIKSVGSALWVAALFGVLNFFLGWVFFVLIGLGTLGLGFVFAFITRWLVNAIVLKITASVSSKVSINGFRTALLGALVISFVGTAAEYVRAEVFVAQPAAAPVDIRL